MDKEEIISAIHSQHLECVINDYLTDWIREELDRTKKDRANYRACLKAIAYAPTAYDVDNVVKKFQEQSYYDSFPKW